MRNNQAASCTRFDSISFGLRTSVRACRFNDRSINLWPVMGFRCSSTSPQIDINYSGSPYTLNHGNSGGGGEKETDNRGYYSPGLNDDIFPNVQAETMLLQAVDSVQLANTIQVKRIHHMQLYSIIIIIHNFSSTYK